jgi:MoxR-like ATPase
VDDETGEMAAFKNVVDAAEQLASVGYLVDERVSTTVFLAADLQKPLLVQSPAGVGKTQLAKAVAEASVAELVRLQCYEGVDESRALYEWNHKKQLLRIQASSGDDRWTTTQDEIRVIA